MNNTELLRRVAARNAEITGQQATRNDTYLPPQVIGETARIGRIAAIKGVSRKVRSAQRVLGSTDPR